MFIRVHSAYVTLRRDKPWLKKSALSALQYVRTIVSREGFLSHTFFFFSPASPLNLTRGRCAIFCFR
jgi:hypothetical protein